ncbi:MAG: alkaline phosphatase family protein [Candidatus Eisenbacteria sp.]|nr:alkaline phosphatase family protein [Candidatus Eisenbacteria bacterium]
MHPRNLCLWLLTIVLLPGLTGCGSSPPASKVLVIGLDGATWDLLDPWIEAGDLPNLERLVEGGAAGTLESVFPPMSPPAWTSAVTGKNPGKHGIYDFWIRPSGSATTIPATSRDRKAEAIWETLARRGRSVGIINVPLTDPPDEVDGFMIAGFPHFDDKGYTYPPELQSRLGDYELDAFGEVLVDGQEAALRDRLVHNLEARARVALELMEDEEWDLFWVVFTGPDKTQHFFWRFLDPEHPFYDEDKAKTFGGAIHDFWQRVDRVVGELLERVDDDTVVIVMSDHGFSPIYREIRLKNWLAREGFFDWERGKVLAYYQGDFGGRIYLNVRGREPRGEVQQGRQYRQVRERIARQLRELTDPETGIRPVTDIRFGEEVFSGPYMDQGPDILFTVKPDYFVIGGEGNAGAPLFGLPSYSFSAYHRREGVIILSGGPVRKGINLTPQGIEGVTPTILYLLGERLPADMDGGVFVEAIDPACLARHEIRFAEPVALVRKEPEGQESLEERRRALGSVPYLQ